MLELMGREEQAMGQEVSRLKYSLDEEKEFKKKLVDETQLLYEKFLSKSICTEELKCGYEIEGWLIDKKNAPTASSHKFIERIKDKDVVPEISKFNFEINGAPHTFHKNTFSNIEKDINSKWARCENVAKMSGWNIATIGSLPTVGLNDLILKNMSPNKRYEALNKRVLLERGGRDIHLNINGKESFEQKFPDVMTESAATSMQVHIGVGLENAKEAYNASIVASSIIAGTCANSPFLFGKELWDETRVPVFEQSVEMDAFTNAYGEKIKRVSLGNGYLKECISELFSENKSVNVLLPEIFENSVEDFRHLSFHNGTIWRWTRPIISKAKNGKINLRLEQRVPSAGPSNIDMVANMAFILGLTHHLSTVENLEGLIPFYTSKYNFYNACKNGLSADMIWFNGQKINMKDLVIDHLIEPSKNALIQMGHDKAEVDYYLIDVFLKRVKMNLNGSNWQKNFVAMYGKDFNSLTEAYVGNQQRGLPLWRWKI